MRKQDFRCEFGCTSLQRRATECSGTMQIDESLGAFSASVARCTNCSVVRCTRCGLLATRHHQGDWVQTSALAALIEGDEREDGKYYCVACDST